MDSSLSSPTPTSLPSPSSPLPSLSSDVPDTRSPNTVANDLMEVGRLFSTTKTSHFSTSKRQHWKWSLGDASPLLHASKMAAPKQKKMIQNKKMLPFSICPMRTWLVAALAVVLLASAAEGYAPVPSFSFLCRSAYWVPKRQDNAPLHGKSGSYDEKAAEEEDQPDTTEDEDLMIPSVDFRGRPAGVVLEDLNWRVEKLRLEEANTRQFLKARPRFLPYDEARKWVHAWGHRWQSEHDWNSWIESGEKRNSYIPSRPDEYYTRIGSWISWVSRR